MLFRNPAGILADDTVSSPILLVHKKLTFGL